MNEILVSVIIPVYNVAPYVERCLKSVFNQTYDIIEIIVVDDCGTDNSMDIVEKIKSNYQGNKVFRIIHHEHNRGLSAARNTGIRNSSGHWLYFLDSDDELPLDSIASFISVAQKYPYAEMIQGKIKEIPNSGYFNTDFYDNIDALCNNDRIRERYFRFDSPIPVTAWNKFVSREFIINNNMFFMEGLIHEDELWTYNVVCQLNNLAFCHYDSYFYYARQNSIMGTTGNKGHIPSIIKLLNCICDSIGGAFKKEQILLYLERFLYRYEEISKIDTRESLLLKFERLLLKEKEFLAFFCIRRCTKSSSSLVFDFYHNELDYFVRNAKIRSLFDILKFEFDMFRVKLGLGRFIKR